MKLIQEKALKEINNALNVGDVILRFKLRLNIEKWGTYKKGDEDIFHIKLLNDQNGLVRYPIEEQWDIVSCEVAYDVGPY
jgi:hypothetical protein